MKHGLADRKPIVRLATVPVAAEEMTLTLSQTEVAVSVIRDRIIDLTLKPASKIDEQMLMGQFKLGRTPAREALNRLSSEGFVKIQRNKGAFVAPMELTHVRQFFDAYFASERMAGYFCNTAQQTLVSDLEAAQAAHDVSAATNDYLQLTEANASFHTRIASASDNEHIIEFCARLHQQARRLSHVIYLLERLREEDRQRLRKKVRQQHGAIIRAVERGDNAKLIELLTVHAQLFHERIEGVLHDSKGLDLTFARPMRRI